MVRLNATEWLTDWVTDMMNTWDAHASKNSTDMTQYKQARKWEKNVPMTGGVHVTKEICALEITISQSHVGGTGHTFLVTYKLVDTWHLPFTKIISWKSWKSIIKRWRKYFSNAIKFQT